METLKSKLKDSLEFRLENKLKNKNTSKLKSQKGITLVALVVTIIILLILAGITITVLFSDNGIIKKAQDAGEKSRIAEAKTKVDLAMADWQIVKRTEDKTFERHLKDTFGDENVTPNGDSFDVKVDGYIFTVKDDGTVTQVGEEEKEPIPEGVYSIAGIEPSPMDLFLYEPITTTTGKLASTEIGGLPEKKARITGMNPKYCNSFGYYSYIDENGEEVTVRDTNYEIIYNGTKISDTLVVPYQVKIDDEYYTVTEVDLMVIARQWKDSMQGLPCVEEIIYPNTVEKIDNSGHFDARYMPTEVLKSIVLPKNLKNMGTNAVVGDMVSEIWIPKSVVSLSSWSFSSGFEGKVCFEGTRQEWLSLTSGVTYLPNLNVKFNCPLTPPTGSKVTLTKENYGDYLGKRVTNYKKIGGEETITVGSTDYMVSTTYRLYYVDFDNKYGDGAGTVYLKADFIDNAYELQSDGSETTSKIKNLNPALYKDGVTPPKSSNLNMQAATWLTDTAKWKGLVTSSSSTKIASSINYIVGAPSLEMMMDSYNAYYKLEGDTPDYSEITPGGARKKLFYQYPYDSNNYGYGVGPCAYNSKEYDEFTSDYSVQSDSKIDGMYYPGSENLNYWLASPSTAEDDRCMISVYGDYGGYLGSDFWWHESAFCPLVSLKPDVQLELED